MAKRIIPDVCTQCGICITECPNEGIDETADGGVLIAFNMCSECAGLEGGSRCAMVCPVDAIEDDPEHRDDEETLLSRAVRANPGLFPVD